MYPRSQIKDPRLATNVIMQVVHALRNQWPCVSNCSYALIFVLGGAGRVDHKVACR